MPNNRAPGRPRPRVGPSKVDATFRPPRVSRSRSPDEGRAERETDAEGSSKPDVVP